MSKLSKSFLIGFGALVLSTVAISASDRFEGVGGGMLGLLPAATGSYCSDGAVRMFLAGREVCVDAFEASPSTACPYDSATNQNITESNFAQPACQPVSVAEQEPWRHVSFTSAQQLCARAGKRLPTAAEWYHFSSGIADDSNCVLQNRAGPLPTGTSQCVTPLGIYDTIGNVWEWVEAEVVDGTFMGRTLPPSGYVQSVDAIGVAETTSGAPETAYGSDYSMTAEDGSYAMMRGGFYGSGSDGGLFAVNASEDRSLAAAGVGFRCVQDISW
jgi:formylglycine-generating enzyme required for sulfatase activity